MANCELNRHYKMQYNKSTIYKREHTTTGKVLNSKILNKPCLCGILLIHLAHDNIQTNWKAEHVVYFITHPLLDKTDYLSIMQSLIYY